MVESLKHKELKDEAKKKLKKMGFSDAEIKKEAWVTYEWEGKKWRKRIDVVGNNGTKKVLFQVGTHSPEEIIILKKQFETHYLAYPETKEEDVIKEEKSLQDKHNELIKLYNQFEKFFEGDEVFDFIKYNEQNKEVFKISRFEPWMILPTSNLLTKNELFNEITLTIDYVDENTVTFGIYAIQKPAVLKFLSISREEKQKYIEELNKLPDGYFVYAGYRKPTYHWSHYINYWYEEKYPANEFNYEILKEMEDAAQQLIDFSGKSLPCFCLLSITINKNEIMKALKQIRPVYQILKTIKTQERTVMEKIKQLPQWDWHINANWIKELHDAYLKQYPDDNISIEDFKSATRKLKKDPEYMQDYD